MWAHCRPAAQVMTMMVFVSDIFLYPILPKKKQILFIRLILKRNKLRAEDLLKLYFSAYRAGMDRGFNPAVFYRVSGSLCHLTRDARGISLPRPIITFKFLAVRAVKVTFTRVPRNSIGVKARSPYARKFQPTTCVRSGISGLDQQNPLTRRNHYGYQVLKFRLAYFSYSVMYGNIWWS